MCFTPPTQSVLSLGSCYSKSEHGSSPTESPRVYSRLAHKVHIPRECTADKRAGTVEAWSQKVKKTFSHETNVNIHV